LSKAQASIEKIMDELEVPLLFMAALQAPRACTNSSQQSQPWNPTAIVTIYIVLGMLYESYGIRDDFIHAASAVSVVVALLVTGQHLL